MSMKMWLNLSARGQAGEEELLLIDVLVAGDVGMVVNPVTCDVQVDGG
jgi:hypothetical protein